ncbi:MAG: hypothetical protein JNL97_07170, partial [Verrucomicrobiales bacterium]|nr:hypothetical protein [Verrucomicrobiales bacterium]
MKTQSTNEPTRKTKPRRGPSHPEGVLSAAFASSVRARGSGLTRVGILALLAGVLSSQAQLVFSPPPTPVLLDGNSAEFPTTSETTVTDSAGGTHTIKALADSNYLYLAFVVNDNSSPCESTARDRVVIQLRGQAAESQPFGSTARQISVEVERTAGAAPAFFRTVLDGDPTPNWVPSALPGSAVQSAGQLIPAGALGSGTGYQVEVKIDRNLFGIPATDAFFRIALAIIDATGTPSATPGRCLAHSAHYPAKPCLELTNDRVDRGQAKLGAYWLQPSVWGTGYFSTATAAAAKDVYLSRKNDADQEEWYYSKDIVATSCEGQGYR